MFVLLKDLLSWPAYIELYWLEDTMQSIHLFKKTNNLVQGTECVKKHDWEKSFGDYDLFRKTSCPISKI